MHCTVLVTLKVACDVIAVLEDQVNVALTAKAIANGFSEFGQDTGLGIIDDGMNGIEAEGVKVIFIEPVKRVVNEEIADRAAVGSVEVDGVAPRRVMTVGEELWCVLVQVIAFRTEVGVDNVEEDHQAVGMGGLDQALEIF